MTPEQFNNLPPHIKAIAEAHREEERKRYEGPEGQKRMQNLLNAVFPEREGGAARCRPATAGSTARREGWEAQKRGDSIYVNPYEVQSDPYYEFEEGWFNADSDLPPEAGAR